MKKVNIIYWSGTGNTEAMAQLIGEGAREKEAQVEILELSQATDKHVEEADFLFLGCPSMGDEELEDSMEDFVSGIENLVKDKRIGLFGSYGWGNGEWMEDWIERMEGLGAKVLGQGCIVQEYPDGENEEKCRAYGRQI